MLTIDAREQRFDFAFHGVVDANRDRSAARRDDHLGGLVDRLRTLVRRRIALHASTRAIDDRAGLAERASDAASRAAGRAGDDGHLAGQRFLSLCPCAWPW